MDNTTPKNQKANELILLGNRIKELRIAKGYTNYELFAFDHNISRAQYGRYEKGEDLRFTSLVKVLNALGVSPEEFFSSGFEGVFGEDVKRKK